MSVEKAASHYPVVNKALRQIRLLTVEEHSNDQPEYQVSVHDLEYCPPFVALSYVWEPTEPQYQVVLNGERIAVRENLHTALNNISNILKSIPGGLNSTGKGKKAVGRDRRNDADPETKLLEYFWVDAICINQEDDFERTHQVRMMSDIYSMATTVLVWLGPSCDEALRLIASSEHTQLRTVYKPYTSVRQKSHLSNVLRPFLDCEYWSRMWIVQEFVLAKDVVFASGSHLLPWSYVEPIFPDCYSYRDNDEHDAVMKLINERRQQIFRQKHSIRPDLQEMIRRFGLLGCSDARDRIFALSGLFDDPLDPVNKILFVDYAFSKAQLCLKILDLASQNMTRKRSIQELSSWLHVALEMDGTSSIRKDKRYQEAFKSILEAAVEDDAPRENWSPGLDPSEWRDESDEEDDFDLSRS